MNTPPQFIEAQCSRLPAIASGFRWRWLATAIVAVAIALAVIPAHAQMWGAPTINIHGVEYIWSQDQSSDDGTNRVDRFYTGDGSGQVEATGRSTDLVGSVAGYNWSTYDSIHGFIIAHGSYFDDVETDSSPGDTCFTGTVEYQRTSSVTTYSRNPDGTLHSERLDSYSGYSGGNVTFTVDSAGVVAGCERGYRTLTPPFSWYLDTTGNLPYSNPSYSPPSPLFGNAYVFVGGTYTIHYLDAQGRYAREEALSFQGNNGATCTLYAHLQSPMTNYTFDLTGYDPAIGQFSGTASNLMANAGANAFTMNASRSAPSFAPNSIWNYDTLLMWRSGQTDPTGASAHVVDLYTSGDGTGQIGDGVTITVLVSGDLNARFQNSGGFSAQVSVVTPSETTTGTYEYSSRRFSGYELQVQNGNRTTPAVCRSSTIWVNGSAYAFVQGFTSNDGSSSDRYSNGSAGDLMLYSTPGSAVAQVTVSNGNELSTGTFDGAAFSVNTPRFLVVYASSPNLDGLPPVFWIDGVLYYRNSAGSGYYNGGTAGGLLASGTEGNYTLTGGNETDTFSANYTGALGAFSVAFQGGGGKVGYPATALGETQLANAYRPEHLPPAVTVKGYKPWVYLGSAGSTACYAYAGPFDVENAEVSTGKTMLLTINSSFDVVLRDTASATSVKTGTYISESHLFQSSADHPLPMPILGSNPLDSFCAWGLRAAPAGRPATVRIAGEIWRLAGYDEATGIATYIGYYPGQTLTIANAGRDGLGDVELTRFDEAGNEVNETGKFYNGTFAMGPLGTGTPVLAGDMAGLVVASTGATDLKIIDGDVDITGNLLSLGSWQSGGSNVAGFTLQYSEFTPVGESQVNARITLAGSRQATSWLWAHATADGEGTTQRAMELGADHALKLYTPTNTPTEAIILNPGGVSEFKGVLRVGEQGDISMGEFTHRPASP